MKKQVAIFSAALILTFSSAAKAEDKKFYFGGGYQIAKSYFGNKEAQGTYTTTETKEVVDDDLTTTVENADGTHTTTTTTEFVDYSVNNVGGYLDNSDYFASVFHNFNVFTGFNINENVAIEAGYFSQSGEKENNNSNQYIYDGKTAKSDSQLQIISLDLVMSSPLVEDIVDLNLIVGASSVLFKTDIDFYDQGSYSNSSSQNYSDIGLNLGIGFETKINDMFSIRSHVKGIILPSGDMVKQIVTASVGLKVSL